MELKIFILYINIIIILTLIFRKITKKIFKYMNIYFYNYKIEYASIYFVTGILTFLSYLLMEKYIKINKILL